jgi:hypothetical protein
VAIMRTRVSRCAGTLKEVPRKWGQYPINVQDAGVDSVRTVQPYAEA